MSQGGGDGSLTCSAFPDQFCSQNLGFHLGASDP